MVASSASATMEVSAPVRRGVTKSQIHHFITKIWVQNRRIRYRSYPRLVWCSIRTACRSCPCPLHHPGLQEGAPDNRRRWVAGAFDIWIFTLGKHQRQLASFNAFQIDDRCRSLSVVQTNGDSCSCCNRSASYMLRWPTKIGTRPNPEWCRIVSIH